LPIGYDPALTAPQAFKSFSRGDIKAFFKLAPHFSQTLAPAGPETLGRMVKC
jgi:hypothetical protein